MKAIEAKLQETKPDRVPVFKQKASEFAKKVVGGFKDWEFYIGESMDPQGMVVLLNFRVRRFVLQYPPAKPTRRRTVLPLTWCSGR